MNTHSRTNSFAIVLAAYVVSFAVAYFTFELAEGQHIITKVAAADLAATVVIFIFSFLLNNSSMYDPYWSVVPPIIAACFWYHAPAGADALRGWLLLGLTTLYAIRLTRNWIIGWPGLGHQDWRYEDFKRNTGKWYWLVSFSGIHVFPTVMVFLGCLPMYPAIDSSVAVNWLDIVATLVTFGSILLAFVADAQMRAFRNNPANKGKTMTLGLWAYHRHPNYIGELFFWVGLFLFSLAACPEWWYYSGMGSLAMYLMFQFASVPMMEKRSIQNRPGYAEATKGIPTFLP